MLNNKYDREWKKHYMNLFIKTQYRTNTYPTNTPSFTIIYISKIHMRRVSSHTMRFIYAPSSKDNEIVIFSTHYNYLNRLDGKIIYRNDVVSLKHIKKYQNKLGNIVFKMLHNGYRYFPPTFNAFENI